MASLEEAQKLNHELARRINDEARRDPASPYVGKYVGIANGQVVIVTDDFDALGDGLEAAEPDNRRVFWIEAGYDPAQVDYPWRCETRFSAFRTPGQEFVVGRTA